MPKMFLRDHCCIVFIVSSLVVVRSLDRVEAFSTSTIATITPVSADRFSDRGVVVATRSKRLGWSFAVMDTNNSDTVDVAVQIDMDVLSNLSYCDTEACARKVLHEAFSVLPRTNKAPLFSSVQIPPGASDRPLSDVDLALQTRIRGTKFKVTELIETNGDRDVDRASIFLLCLLMATSGSAVVVNQLFPGIPEILRFLIVWILSFAPLGFVGAGIVLPQDLIQGPILSLQRILFPSFRRRMIQHEAGHFLVAYLLGKPIKAYRATNAIKNAVEFYPLADPEQGTERARLLGFDQRRNSQSVADEMAKSPPVTKVNRPYFSQDGQGRNLIREQSVFRTNAHSPNDEELVDTPSSKYTTMSPKLVWPYRGLDQQTLDELTVISLGGVCAEILGFGNAEGGVADLNQLRQLFSYAEENNGPATIADKQMENRIRFAIGYGITLLRRNLLALDALARVMEQGGTVEECVVAIEMSSTSSSRNDSNVDNYEERRKIWLQGSNSLEQLVLSVGRKNADMLDDTKAEGKGGGEQQPRLFMNPTTNDDPLIAALAIAAAFYLWAVSGGLSLH